VSTSPIVVGVDGSAPSAVALEWAAREAAMRERPLRILHAFVWPATGAYVGPSPEGPPDGGLRNLAEEMLTDSAARARSIAPGIEVSTELAVSAPAARLVEESRDAAIVVVGSRGLGGFTGLVLGSVGVQVSSHAHCPVVVVRSGAPGDPVGGPVVAGVDGSESTAEVLSFAFEEAALRGATLTVMHAWTAPLSTRPGDTRPLVYDLDAVNKGEGRLIAEALTGWQEKYPKVPVRRLLLHQAPAKELIRLSHGAQLLVLGARGRGGFRGLLLGSVSQAAIQHAWCPVAVVR
jgi:nucleotide-binding universal stress UspA family protein